MLKKIFWIYISVKHFLLKHERFTILKIDPPKILTHRGITFGKKVRIFWNSRIECIYKYNDEVYQPNIIIENDVSIQQNCHITCANKIFIGEKTSIINNVTITDILHPYDFGNPRFNKLHVGEITIGHDCFIGSNAVLLGNIKIGNNCTIGANTVLKDFTCDDYCIIAGIPGKIIKIYDKENNIWISKK
ncbi:acyltransferase [Proteus faecis]|uniref:acyltransferase n=1 Tax=Proteus faecis TaxID=2050967 RepID=UPI003075C115